MAKVVQYMQSVTEEVTVRAGMREMIIRSTRTETVAFLTDGIETLELVTASKGAIGYGTVSLLASETVPRLLLTA